MTWRSVERNRWQTRQRFIVNPAEVSYDSYEITFRPWKGIAQSLKNSQLHPLFKVAS
jgi:hypothetical protein